MGNKLSSSQVNQPPTLTPKDDEPPTPVSEEDKVDEQDDDNEDDAPSKNTNQPAISQVF